MEGADAAAVEAAALPSRSSAAVADAVDVVTVATALARFADAFVRGDAALQPHLKSEDPAVAAGAAGRAHFAALATVVGRSFGAKVLDAQRGGATVLLNVYAAWCGHCKVSFLLCTVTFYANLAHTLTRSP